MPTSGALIIRGGFTVMTNCDKLSQNRNDVSLCLNTHPKRGLSKTCSSCRLKLTSVNDTNTTEKTLEVN